MAIKRDNSYVWVTWVTKLIAGEAQCQWAAWFRANHQDYKKIPSDFDLAKWTAEHAALLNQQAQMHRSSGDIVTVEKQNAFRLKGNNGVTLAGQADIIAVNASNILVTDCKTGSPKHSDKIQVMIYLLVFPLVKPELKGKQWTGRVCYRDHEVMVPAEAIDSEFRASFRRTMESMSMTNSPVKVPSFGECRFCDIDTSECAERVSAPTADSDPQHDLF